MSEATPKEPEPRNYLTLTEAAFQLRIGLSSVVNRIVRGQLKAEPGPNGRGWRIDPASVQEYIAVRDIIEAASRRRLG